MASDDEKIKAEEDTVEELKEPEVEEESKKRKLTDQDEEEDDDAKKVKVDDDALLLPKDDGEGPAPIAACKEGQNHFKDNDVLSGRGGGTNVHLGNRNFRDLINLHRRAYLKARKNDKPTISRAIVRSIRESNGAFLKKDEKSGLWCKLFPP
jgi:hypothetical protein